jgi:hypothetical protein
MSITFKPRKRRSIAAIAALCCGASILAGCGGSKPSHATSSTSTTTVTATRAGAPLSDPDVGDAASQVKPGKHPALGVGHNSAARRGHAQQPRSVKIVRAGRVHRARASTPPNDDQNSTGAKGLNPCTLVSRAQAQTATGVALRAGIEAPLGPTCIFRPSSAGAEITLALEQGVKLGQASQALHTPRRLTIQGRAAFCAEGHQQTLVMSVRPGQVLTVTAPCKAAARLASIVVGRLTA